MFEQRGRRLFFLLFSRDGISRRWFVATLLVALFTSGLLEAICPLANSVFAQEDDARRRQEILPQYIPRNRRIRETLASVDQLQANGRVAEAIKTVQWVLDQPHDMLVFGEGGSPASIKKMAEAKLRSFPADWRKQYERTFGLQARQLLEEAQHRDDDRSAVEVLRRFSATSAGEEAALWLASRWLDRGDAQSALAVLLPADPTAAGWLELPQKRLQSARLAASASGQLELAHTIEQVLQATGEPASERSVQDSQVAVPRKGTHPSLEVLTVAGDADAASREENAVPVLRPLWATTLVNFRGSPHLSSVLDGWRSQLQEANVAPVIPHLPLIVRDQVIVRNFEGVCGLDRSSGQTLWAFPCESSISGWIDEAVRHRRLDVDTVGSFPGETLQSWFSANTQMGYLSSDGVRLFVIDSLTPPSTKGNGKQDQFQARTPDVPRVDESNRLLALELPHPSAPSETASPRLLWSYGRSLQNADPSLQDRFFFGPPLPNAGRLLSIVETDREIRLMALQSETGGVLWEQPLASVDRPAVHDGDRAFTACLPILAGNLILCPTQAGVLSAVESVTGSLRWSFYDGDLPTEQQGRQRNVVVARGRPGFAPSTMVQGTHVVHLPTYSSFVHCVNRDTGKVLWSVPRLRACAIAAITEESVMLLEDQACRALNLADGREIWRQALPTIVGTGVRLGDDYLVPLDQGRFALIHLATGRQHAWQPPRGHLALGNLTICGDMVYSVGPSGVTAFPQAQFVSRQLADKSSTLAVVDRALYHVDLHLAEGKIESAQVGLQQALQASLPEKHRAELNGLLREILYHQLESPAGKRDALLGQIRGLATTDAEQGRYLARLSRSAITAKDLPQLRQAMLQIAKLPTDVVFPSADDAGWKQSASACCRQLLAELNQEFPDFVRAIRQELLDRLTTSEPTPQTLAGWRFALRVAGDDLAAAPLRHMMAQRLQADHQYQAAELLLLQNRASGDSQVIAEATAGLWELWSQAGWPRDAASLLNELAGELAETRLRTGQTGAEYVSGISPRSDAKQWQLRMAHPRGRMESASIRRTSDLEILSSGLVPADSASKTTGSAGRNRAGGESRDQFRFGEFARRLSPNAPLTADVLVRPQGQQSSLVVVDQSTSQVIRTWTISSRHSHPWPGNSAFQYHFLPISVPGELRGYSLLQLGDDAPVWTQTPAELDRRRMIPLVGPGGANFVTFQAQHMLFVCDPWDGAILWQRSDLEPGSGLYAEPGSGITGDERCLAVFAPDRLGFTTYDTSTGKTLRTGRLDLEPRQFRRAFGRKIFSVTQVKGQWQTRVWDPLNDDWELTEALGERNLATMAVGSSEIGWLAANGHLHIYDVPRAKRTLDLSLPAEEMEGLNSLRFIRDGERYYLNLQRNMPVAQTVQYNYPAGDTVVPCLHIRDDLYGIDRQTGKIAWKRTVPSRTLLRLEPEGLPFLVLLSRIRDRHDGNQQSLLVEVLDASTGELLGRQENLTADRIVNAAYDGVEQTLRLFGQKTSFEIHLIIDRNRREW